MNADEIIYFFENKLFDYKLLPKNPFIQKEWGYQVFPMPMRKNEDDDYTCFSEELLEALILSIVNVIGVRKIFIINYLAYKSDLSDTFPDSFFSVKDFTVENIVAAMSENLSYLGLCVFDESFEWLLVSVADEYSMLGANKEICNEFEKNYKTSPEIFNDFKKSVNSGHTFISQDVENQLLAIYRNEKV